MFRFFVFVLLGGWVLWFLVDKQLASLGLVLPPARDTLLADFQLAFDLLKGGFLRAAFVFIWHAHYILLALTGGLLLSLLAESIGGFFRRRHLRRLMWPQPRSAQPLSHGDIPEASPRSGQAE